jgi:hypothetical protein
VILRDAWPQVEDLMLSSNPLVSKAAVELVCNLVQDPRGMALYADGSAAAKQRLHILVALADAEDEGVGVIVLTHQASDAIVEQSQLLDLAFLLDAFPEIQEILERWSPPPVDPVTSPEFRQLLASSPALLAHIAGHNHRNRVRAICPDGSALRAGEGRCQPGDNGETGYWEITTASGIDFPHQARFFEVVDVGEGAAALYLTLQEPRIPAGSFSEHGRYISVVGEELGGGSFGGLGELGDRNVLLPLSLSPAMAANWAGFGVTTIQSETSLRGSYAPLPPLPEWPE